MIRILTGFVLLLICHVVYSQEPGTIHRLKTDSLPLFDEKTSADLKFVNYLFGKNENDDAIFVLNSLIIKQNNSRLLQDSVDYCLGWAHYAKKNLDTSALFFLKVSPLSASYFKSRFFAAYEFTHLHQYAQANSILEDLHPETELQKELLEFELAGLDILQRNYHDFDKHAAHFTHEYYPMAKEETDIADFKEHIISHRNKSMTLAGIMSAIIPGSGKVYAGKKGEGIGAFLVVLSLGLVTRENYMKDGLGDFKTLIFGSLFSVYYVGNIWGSAISAKRTNEQYSNEMDNRILFNLHIPLRTFFN